VPYHALTGAERETYNARRRLLECLGRHLRHAAVERQRCRMLADKHAATTGASVLHSFLHRSTFSFGCSLSAVPYIPPNLESKSDATFPQFWAHVSPQFMTQVSPPF